jgi:hypothetical protein
LKSGEPTLVFTKKQAQSSQRDTWLVEAFAVVGAQSRHVGGEMVEAAARNRLERSLRL